MDRLARKLVNSTTKIIIVIIVVTITIIGSWVLTQQNKANEESKKDPENILGDTIGEVSTKYCGETGSKGVKYSKFYISDRVFYCYDFNGAFMNSDLDNYILSSYSTYNSAGHFYFDVDTTQTDLRPLKIDNPEQFVGQMATSLCPKYSLANFKILATDEHMGISIISCKNISQYSMYQDVIITDVYYGADEKNDNNFDEYFEQNNAKGTRKLILMGKYITDGQRH